MSKHLIVVVQSNGESNLAACGGLCYRSLLVVEQFNLLQVSKQEDNMTE